MMRLDIEVHSLYVEEALLSLDYATSPFALSYFMKTRASHWIQQRVKQRFETEGDSASGQWQLLSDKTIKIREAAGFVPILINRRTYALHNWVTRSRGDVFPSPSVTVLVWPGDPASPELGLKMITAQRGKFMPKTPARPVAAVDETDLMAILTLLGDFVIRGEFSRSRTLAR